ncbi:MAG: phosphonate C-P lyase system protein PhnL [Alphaproteobacteria bacterium]
MTLAIDANALAKTFTLHLQDGAELPVLRDTALKVKPGECVALTGRSGAGKSTLMRCLYGNYRPTGGSIRLREGDEMVELVGAEPRVVLRLRRATIGYVSQFLRVIPRIPTVRLVMEPLLALGVEEDVARTRAETLLARLNLPERLWTLPPATFSGGEQQRVNIARCFVVDYPILLLDEPTASLDPDNRQVVMDLIKEARERAAAVVGIFHDVEVRSAVASRNFEMAA